VREELVDGAVSHQGNQHTAIRDLDGVGWTDGAWLMPLCVEGMEELFLGRLETAVRDVGLVLLLDDGVNQLPDHAPHELLHGEREDRVANLAGLHNTRQLRSHVSQDSPCLRFTQSSMSEEGISKPPMWPCASHRNFADKFALL